MSNNITRRDLDVLIDFLKQDDPRLTQSENVALFEAEWSEWLGAKHSVFVNSGASANLITMATLKETIGTGEIIVPSLTWVSDISSVIQTGFTPVFVDIDPKTLGMDAKQVLRKITSDTKAVFLTHTLGYNGLSDFLLDGLKSMNVPLIEDVCESHGATFGNRKLGTFGLMSNFSFYYAHHMSTIEGGIVSTDDPNLYQTLRMLRSHGMVRESTDDLVRRRYQEQYPELNPDFIFAAPGYNMRSTELNAVIGRSQLHRLDENNIRRRANLEVFLNNLDSDVYRTDFYVEGNSNYALTLILKDPDPVLRNWVIHAMESNGIEFRQGTAGGGNQLRQPYLQGIVSPVEYKNYPETEHVHFNGFYIGNYPDLQQSQIIEFCKILNDCSYTATL